jgi:saccharopine dehydrogenase-like NADP-dependent oxidoreductase
MRVLVVGSGGVGAAVAAVAHRRDFFERMVLPDVDEDRARRAIEPHGDERLGAASVDASDAAAITKLARAEGVDAILNAVDPRFNPPIFQAAFDAGCTYLDMAMTLSNAETGEKLGDAQFAQADRWEAAGRLGLVGIGVEPGLSDVFARYARDQHEEVLLVPRWIDCRRVDFKYGLGEEFIEVLKTLHKLGLDSTKPVTVRGVEVAPRDVVAAALPDPATLGDRMRGKTCAGTYVTGTGKDGRPRATYLYHVLDNEHSMREWGHQAVVLQTALNPIAALELLANGSWEGTGVLGPEAFPAGPFLELLADYGAPHGIEDR